MDATTTSPTQQLRAYVDYLRDLGIYDLYRRENPQTLISDALRESLVVGMRTHARPSRPPRHCRLRQVVRLRHLPNPQPRAWTKPQRR